VHRLVDGKPVAQRVQARAQGPIVPPEPADQILEPDVGLLRGMLERFDAGRHYARQFRGRFAKPTIAGRRSPSLIWINAVP
jgi:hypothetical protein